MTGDLLNEMIDRAAVRQFNYDILCNLEELIDALMNEVSKVILVLDMITFSYKALYYGIIMYMETLSTILP